MVGLLLVVLVFAAFPLGSRVDLWTRVEKSPIVEATKGYVLGNASSTAVVAESLAGNTAKPYWDKIKTKADTEIGLNIPKFGKWATGMLSRGFSRLASFLASSAN